MKKFMKVVLSMVLVFTLMMGMSQTVLAKEKDLQSAYFELVVYARNGNIPLDMSYQEFVDGYGEQSYKNVQAYLDAYYAVLQPQQSPNSGLSANEYALNAYGYSVRSSSSGGDWHYNIGTTLPANANPVYSKYNLLQKVQKGDIIHESKGGFGITGHTAIVEGIFYDSGKGVYYVRIIEAVGDGVVRSVLDDTRVDSKDVSIYRVPTTYSKKSAAVSFTIGELGSSYYLDFKHDYSSSETDWYCSELVWAGYKNQGIDIETDAFFNEPGITPRDIKNNDDLTRIYFK